ncbi:GDSL-type esterase/lipase family protein [Xanthomonas cerealis]|uniref:GDSL-type esterase/lipase family protein n=1 Tax=Xanthomonas cerealis TaxID=3390025 RepID=UPI00210D9B44|nr:GDSL-type esterase/lipase family protein [Xanthomonas translucens]
MLAQARAHADTPLLLIGDSITHNYDKANAPDQDFQPTWQTFYGSRGALNLGFSGDATEHVLWRLQRGEVDGLQPKVAVLLFGSNNTGYEQHSAADTVLGIDAVVATLEQRLPTTRILLLGLLPSAGSAQARRRRTRATPRSITRWRCATATIRVSPTSTSARSSARTARSTRACSTTRGCLPPATPCIRTRAASGAWPRRSSRPWRACSASRRGYRWRR